MANTIRIALIRNSHSSHTAGLQNQLATHSAVVQVAERCRDLPAQLSGANPPDLILTDLYLADGTWEDILRIAEKAPAAVNVIVVSRLVDIPLYVEALEKGAFDFITPPFEPSELSHVLRTAFWNVVQKRETQLRGSPLTGSSRIQPDVRAVN